MKPRSSMSRTVVVLFASVFAGTVTLAQTNPVPLINQPLVPDAVAPGGAGFTLIVNGAGFVSTSVVNWNGSARGTIFVSNSQLTADILNSDILNFNTASVTVVNPSPGGGTSNVAFLEATIPTSAIALGRADYGAGSGPVSIATADFNRDGKLDLAVTNIFSNTVSVLLGNGDGSFQPPVDYATGIEPGSVAAGDFNKDGVPDLAVTNQCADSRCLDNTPSTVSVFLGRGDGTFSTRVDYGAGDLPNSVVVADFNADGNLDLAVANNGSNTISVLLGNGDGTFNPKVDYPSGSGPDSVAVGDFNGDGKLDIAVANFNDNTVSILLGNGDGTFRPRVDYVTGSGPTLAVGDLNGDGKLDLAVANFNDNTVSVLLGNGDGTFAPKVDYGTGNFPVFGGVADLNGDDKPDLVIANNGADTVSVLLGDGDGTFQAHTDYPTGRLPTLVAVGDFNRDGRLDLAISDSEGGVSVLLQLATVTVSPANLNFGNALIGTQSPAQKVTLANTGGSPLTIASIVITGADFGQKNNCGSGLPPGASCTINVVFAPTQVGPRAASLSITDNALGSPQLVSLSGNGFASGPNATLSQNGLTFATQLVGTSSPAQPVTLTNWGTQTLSITGGSISSDFGQTDNCHPSLAPGASCNINVTFTPKQRGTRNGTLSIRDNAPDSPQTVSLTGVGTVVEMNPNALDFGTVTVGQTKTLPTTLTNVGSVQLNITSIMITQDPTDFSQQNTCDGALGAGQSCTINVTFKPTQTGPLSADVSISDDGGGSPQQVSLSGTGQAACGGRCGRFGGCPTGCFCTAGFCRKRAVADLPKELFFEPNLAVSIACGK
jgi:hypothetical protein